LLISLRLTRDIWRDSTEGQQHFADPALALEAIRRFIEAFGGDGETRQER
jgi:carboxylesterase type B